MDYIFRRNTGSSGPNTKATGSEEECSPCICALRCWASLPIPFPLPPAPDHGRSLLSCYVLREQSESATKQELKPNLEGTDLKVVITYFQFENCLSWEIQNLFAECINNIVIIGTFFLYQPSHFKHSFRRISKKICQQNTNEILFPAHILFITFFTWFYSHDFKINQEH